MYVGWVARRNSFSDGMPLRNERGDVVLVFAGEEFPEPGTELRLKNEGHEIAPVGPVVPGTPLRRRSIIPAGVEWQVSRASHRPGSRIRDAVQRPLWNEPRLSITSRRMRSISQPRPKPFLPCILNCERWIRGELENSSHAARF